MKGKESSGGYKEEGNRNGKLVIRSMENKHKRNRTKTNMNRLKAEFVKRR